MNIQKTSYASNPMVKKIRRKFILVNVLSYIAIIALFSAVSYCIFFFQTWVRINNTLDFIVEEGGMLTDPRVAEVSDDTPSSDIAAVRFSPEFRYSTRYFTVFLDEDGEIADIYLQHIASVSEEDAKEYAQKALLHRQTFRASILNFRRIGTYYYKVGNDGGKIFIVFLDCTDQLNSYTRMITSSGITLAAASLLIFTFTVLMSMRAIQPEIENLQKQREFITNAGHELKTPLAVIRANTELTEMLNGSSEWTQSTLRQIDRMSELIKVFVTLAKSEEGIDETVFADLSLSEAVEDVCRTFGPVAVQAGKAMETHIQPGITVSGDQSTLQAIITILVDNAVKYCDDDGSISVRTSSKGKTAVLSVSNSFADGKDADYTRFFDRFYRADASHNIDKGGYGIGLSIAKNIAEQHKGRLDVYWKDGSITFEFSLPLIR